MALKVKSLLIARASGLTTTLGRRLRERCTGSKSGVEGEAAVGDVGVGACSDVEEEIEGTPRKPVVRRVDSDWGVVQHT